MKICPKCKISKETTEFHKSKPTKDGLHTWCKSCNKEYNATPKVRAMRLGYEKDNFEKIIDVLGSKCASCGEKYTRGVKMPNLQIHHKFYTEEDKEYKKKYGVNQHKYEALRMIKTNKINELKKKYTLLCGQCNMLEAWVRKDGVKAFEAYCWLHEQGYFDEALRDDAKFKKLSEFMKD